MMTALRVRVVAGLTGLTVLCLGSVAGAGARPAGEVAAAVDAVIHAELSAAGIEPAPRVGAEDFLRRVTLDLSGTLPSPAEVTLFGIDPDPQKRARRIESLLESDAFAANWARYWRDVIFSRATDMRARIMQPAFEAWMTEQLRENRPWDAIATDLLTATGTVTENGATALMFAHGGDAAEIAGEVSRIFLGVQIQCANCHDHPTDPWKREQFHELAAFFPRVRVRLRMDTTPRTFEVASFDQGRFGGRGADGGFLQNPDRLLRAFDRNRDGKLSKAEVENTPLARFFERVIERADANDDGALNLAELRDVAQLVVGQGGRGNVEYFMPDLDNPQSRGTPVEPVLFATETKVTRGLKDVDRRGELARQLTSPENPWFARAIVNRVWAELLGEGFYMPVDDMGPARTPQYGEALDILCREFVASGHDLKWLYRTIVSTDAYQRQIRVRDASGGTPAFASAAPTRLRADQLYDSIATVLGTGDVASPQSGRRGFGAYGMQRNSRTAFATLFGFDPSTPQDEVSGTVPQALFLMNSPLLHNQLRGDGNTRLAALLRKHTDNEEAVRELYLLVLSREPSEKEVAICLEYVDEVGRRNEAFEDVMWSLLNSSEFLSKR